MNIYMHMDMEEGTPLVRYPLQPYLVWIWYPFLVLMVGYDIWNITLVFEKDSINQIKVESHL